MRNKVVDNLTILSVRRQFRELVKDDTHGATLLPKWLTGQGDVPWDERTFDAQRLFLLRVKNGHIEQRPSGVAPGTQFGGKGAPVLIDLTAADGGFGEWRSAYWEPLIQSSLPQDASTSSEEEPQPYPVRGAFRLLTAINPA